MQARAGDAGCQRVPPVPAPRIEQGAKRMEPRLHRPRPARAGSSHGLRQATSGTTLSNTHGQLRARLPGQAPSRPYAARPRIAYRGPRRQRTRHNLPRPKARAARRLEQEEERLSLPAPFLTLIKGPTVNHVFFAPNDSNCAAFMAPGSSISAAAFAASI